MNGEELRQLTTELLDGREIGASKYAQLLKVAKRKREKMRPWMALRTVDTSLTWTGADTYQTLKSLPADFLKPFNAYVPRERLGAPRTPIVLTAGDEVIYTQGIPLGAQLQVKDTQFYHYFDFAQKKFGLTGRANRVYTINLHYIKSSTDPNSNGGDLDAWTWDLSNDDALILAVDIAMMQKGGIDFDDINARMVQFHGLDVRDLQRGMIKWDDELQRASLSK